MHEDKGKTKKENGIMPIMVDIKLIKNQNKITNIFNKYFLFIVDSVIPNKNIYPNLKLM
jgi:hypothetical protein